MKIVAMYLPQFHRTKENDMWWGDGFTDWVSASNAKPLFDGHYQPHIPLNDNYYNLLDKETMKWQAELLKKYGIDGLCFYHYYFENGRRVLEKPAENLLEWTDIKIPFCFSWANETWARSWANIKGANVWSNLREDETDRSDGILLKQDYGDKGAWKEHFMYLLPFFKDSRYIKIDNKPILFIYKADQIHCLDEMINCWRLLANKNGLDGIYVIGGNSNGASFCELDAEYYHEPVYANKKVLQGYYSSDIKRLLYSDVWSEILTGNKGNKKTYYGGFVGYDDTPRRGDGGIVIENSTPELFGGFLAQLMAKNEAEGNEITIINAWNEWGEGMHLEPDKKFGYAYLERVLEAKKNYKDLLPYYRDAAKKDFEDRDNKHELYLNDLDMWMLLRERGVSIARWLKDNNYHSVAIYGYGIMGRHLAEELEKNSDIQLLGIIDKQKQMIHVDVPKYFPDELLPKCDVIIVASYYFFESVKTALGDSANLLSLGSIIHKLSDEYM